MKLHGLSRIVLRFTWDRLKVSFWFTPLVMSMGAILLARVMNRVDELLPAAILQNNLFAMYGSANELRAVLITMATNTMATAGVVFSLLTLPLSTVAAQYGSRLLRVFLADRTSQFVLGMYSATFVYCVTAAASLAREDIQLTRSRVMVTVAVLLLLASTASLIILVQHISTMLQAPNIAAAAGVELREVVHTETLGEAWVGNDQSLGPGTMEPLPDKLTSTAGYAVRLQHTGYIKFIDIEYLLALASERDMVIRLLCRPGRFVSSGSEVAQIWSADQADGRLNRQICRAFLVGNQRTPAQDVEYGINQLVEIAVRAMASGIRDPFTVMTCLDQMGDSLAHFARQGEISPYVYDREGQLRLIIEPVTFAGMLSAAFDMLRHYSRDNARIMLHMLDIIAVICQQVQSPAVHQELLHHINLIEAESLVGTLIEQDRQRIHLRCEALQVQLTATRLSEAT